jgi:hypothetical protein
MRRITIGREDQCNGRNLAGWPGQPAKLDGDITKADYFVSDVGRPSCAVPRPGRGSRDDLTSCRVIEGVFHALAAKPPIPAILSTLFTARKDAINRSGVPNDAPRIVYVCLGFPCECRERRPQCQSDNYRLPHVRLLLSFLLALVLLFLVLLFLVLLFLVGNRPRFGQ